MGIYLQISNVGYGSMNEEPQLPNYNADMLQEADEDGGTEEDEDEEFGHNSSRKYQLKFSYKDFKVDFIFPIYGKPMLDSTTKADIVFETLVSRASHLFLLSTDEDYRNNFKGEQMKLLEVKELKK